MERRESEEKDTDNNNTWYSLIRDQSATSGIILCIPCGTCLGRFWRCPTSSYRAARRRGWWPGGPSLSTDAPASVATSSDRWITTNWVGRWKPRCGRFPSETSRGGTLISRPTPRWMGITNGKRYPWIRARRFIRTLYRTAGPGCLRLPSSSAPPRTLFSRRPLAWMYWSVWSSPRAAALPARWRSTRRTEQTSSTQGSRVTDRFRALPARGQPLLTTTHTSQVDIRHF